MKTKLALYSASIIALYTVSLAVQADTISPINEATPTYVDQQDVALDAQSDLMANPPLSSEERKDFSGFYAGIGANYASSKSTVKITITSPATTYKKDLSSNDPGANINFGYGNMWGRFYLGGEIFFNYAPMDLKDENISAKISSDYEAGAALKVGVALFNSAMLYGLGGFSYTTLDAKFANLSSEKNSTFAPMFGVGLEYLFTNNWGAKLQYTFTSYDDISQDLPGMAKATFEDGSRNSLTLDLTYHF